MLSIIEKNKNMEPTSTIWKEKATLGSYGYQTFSITIILALLSGKVLILEPQHQTQAQLLPGR